MPIANCQEGGKPGYKYGESGKCYTYTAGNEAGKMAARKAAIRQGMATEPDKFKKSEVLYKNDDEQLVFGWANVSIRKTGEQITDSQDHQIDTEQLEYAMYAYNLVFRKMGVNHILKSKGLLIESMVFTKEKLEKMGLPGEILPEAAWVGFYIPDRELYNKVKEGDYEMFSIEGRAIVKEVKDDQ